MKAVKKLAVIETGGKQYLVKEGEKVSIEKIEVDDKKKEIIFDKVLLVGDEKDLKVGSPYIKGAKVEAELKEQKKGEKIRIIKHKPKKRYLKRQGHRQLLTEVEIKKISA